MADLFNEINIFDEFNVSATTEVNGCPPIPECRRELPQKAELTVYSILGSCADGEPLSNVPIELYKLGGCKSPGLELVGCKFTDEKGMVKFKCLDPGEYAVKEVVNPCILEPEYYPSYRVVFCVPSDGYTGRLEETITILNILVHGENCLLNFDCGCPSCINNMNSCSNYANNCCGNNYVNNCCGDNANNFYGHGSGNYIENNCCGCR